MRVTGDSTKTSISGCRGRPSRHRPAKLGAPTSDASTTCLIRSNGGGFGFFIDFKLNYSLEYPERWYWSTRTWRANPVCQAPANQPQHQPPPTPMRRPAACHHLLLFKNPMGTIILRFSRDFQLKLFYNFIFYQHTKKKISK